MPPKRSQNSNKSRDVNRSKRNVSKSPTKRMNSSAEISEESTDDEEYREESSNNYHPQENKSNRQEYPKRRQPFSSFQNHNGVMRIERGLTKKELEAMRSQLFKTNNLAVNKKKMNTLMKYWWLLLLGSVCFIIVTYFTKMVIYHNSSNEMQDVDLLKSIRENFPQQDEQFWKAIDSGINETLSFKYPTSFIFLFESDGEATATRLLKDLSEYVFFRITNCKSPPISFKEVLQSSNFSEYGSVLAHLEGKLENNCLMLVENLDEVPGEFAQSFHNFCDDVSPVVKKSVFFFTLKVNNFKSSPSHDLKYTEEVLRKRWHNIESDKFDPLFTRISSMLLRVHPQTHV